jgi:hypothetical protein
MKAIFLDEPLIFYLIPRKYPLISDTLSLSLRREIDNLTLTPEIEFEIGEKLQITITDQPIEFKTGDKYEIELTNDSEVIYRGKMIILKTGTNTQNFEYGNQNGRFSY